MHESVHQSSSNEILFNLEKGGNSVTTQIKLEDSMLSEISQLLKDK